MERPQGIAFVHPGLHLTVGHLERLNAELELPDAPSPQFQIEIATTSTTQFFVDPVFHLLNLESHEGGASRGIDALL